MQIVGIMLVRNEDLHVAWAIENILDFCDRIIVLDNYSTDCTYDVLAKLAKQYAKIELRRWWNAKKSQKSLRQFYQTPTWVLGVDGDEIYDPYGLAVVRKRILQGEFDSVYRIGIDFLHCTDICFDTCVAHGYQPEKRTWEKLVNFNLVKGWENENRERLHGHPIFTAAKKIDSISLGAPKWDGAILRCLHLCFMQRSSGVKKYPFTLIGWSRRRKKLCKPNPSGNPHNARPGPGDTVEYKMQNYAAAQLTRHSITDFIKS